MNVTIVHDYLTQRGGAERVVLSMLKAFPGAPLVTSFYNPRTTFPEFAEADIRTLGVNRVRMLRRNHRLALPVLAPAFSRLKIESDLVLCSSSGWAHGTTVEGRKVVYCYSPARWLYQTSRYLGDGYPAGRRALSLLRPHLLRWDARAAATADCYLTSSTAVAERIREIYGIEARILAPPTTIDPAGERQEVAGIEPGFVLCVSRLLAYKNLDAVVNAMRELPDLSLVIVGTGPERSRLAERAPDNVRFAGTASDAEIRWLYGECVGLVAASYEDYGLTPLEAACFGKPVAALRWGGFLDTVIEGTTGVFFDVPDAASIAAGIRSMLATHFDPATLMSHAEENSEARFLAKLRDLAGLRGGGSSPPVAASADNATSHHGGALAEFQDGT